MRSPPSVLPTVYSSTNTMTSTQLSTCKLSKTSPVDNHTFWLPYWRLPNIVKHRTFWSSNFSVPFCQKRYYRFPKFAEYQIIFEIRTHRNPATLITELLIALLTNDKIFDFRTVDYRAFKNRPPARSILSISQHFRLSYFSIAHLLWLRYFRYPY